MRGGAIPLLCWGGILFVLYALNWVWEGRAIQIATTVFALLMVFGGALMLWLRRREVIRRGPPAPRPETLALPTASLAAAVAGLSVGMILFGLAWATFLVLFGVFLLIVSLARVALELRAERASRVHAETEQQ